MYIGYTFIKQWHQRQQKATKRSLQVYAVVCDNCSSLFFRCSKTLSKNRLNNWVKHYCGHCGDSYKLAQRDSANRKRTLKYDASSTVPISRLR